MDLPDDVLARPMSMLGIRTLVAARVVCSRWLACVESPAVGALSADTAEPLLVLTGGCVTNGEEPSNRVSFRFGIEGSWFDGPPMPEPRYRHGAVVVGRKIYVVGGLTEMFTKATRTLIYDVWTATWRDAPGLRRSRQSSVVAALPDGRVLVAGGIDCDGYDELRSCEIFDPATEVWSEAAPLAHPRWWAQGAVLDGRAHVVGGKANGSESRTMERYDAAADRWELLPPCPFTVNKGCAAVAGGHLCVFAKDGCSVYVPSPEDPPTLRRVEKNEVKGLWIDDDWSDGLGVSMPVEVRGLRGRIIGSHGAVSQGDEGHVGPLDILITDDDSDCRMWMRQWWLDLPRPNFELEHTTCVSVGDDILLVGGKNQYRGDQSRYDAMDTLLLEQFGTGLNSVYDEIRDLDLAQFEASKFDHVFSLERLWTSDGVHLSVRRCYERVGARVCAQSEDAAITVVRL